MATTKKKTNEELAAYYDTHDTSAKMDGGQWVEALKERAQARGIRYTALLREILEQAVYGTHPVGGAELAEINERLARIEAELGTRPSQAASDPRR